MHRFYLGGDLNGRVCLFVGNETGDPAPVRTDGPTWQRYLDAAEGLGYRPGEYLLITIVPADEVKIDESVLPPEEKDEP